MLDTASLAEDLTRLELLLRPLLAAGRRLESGAALRLAPQRYHSCEVLLPALAAAAEILRRLSRASLPVDTGSGEELRQRFHLTEREGEVLRLLLPGRSNSDVARALGISEHTARHHTERVLAKLHVHSRAQLASAVWGRVGAAGER